MTSWGKIRMWGLVLALLVNIMIPFFAQYDLTNLQKQPFHSVDLTGLFGDKILICTKEGFSWVSVKDIVKGDMEHHPDPEMKCSLCYLAVHGPTLTLSKASDIISSQLSSLLIHYGELDLSHLTEIKSYAWQARSPPMLFVF